MFAPGPQPRPEQVEADLVRQQQENAEQEAQHRVEQGGGVADRRPGRKRSWWHRLFRS